MVTCDISIIGLGWLGWPLAKRLASDGFRVQGSVTSVTKQQQLSAEETDVAVVCWQAGEQASLPESLLAPMMIITIPPGKTPHYVATLQRLITQAKQCGVRHQIYISSTSVYGGNGHCNELSPLQPETTQAESLVQVEQYVQQAGFSCWHILRPAGLFGPGRYPGRFLSGKTLDGGGRVVNLVHQTDVIGCIRALLSCTQSDIFNLAAPTHPTRAAFYHQACLLAGLPEPHFSDMNDDGRWIEADKVERALNYRYQITDLFRWLQQHAAGEQ